MRRVWSGRVPVPAGAMRLKRAIALTSVSAIFCSSPRARRLAACNSGCGSDVAGILLGLQKFATFSKDLASVGALGQQLPLVPLAPAGDNALKFADAYQKALVDPLALKEHFDDLDGSYPLNSGEGRTGTLTVTTVPGDVETLTTDVSLTRTVASAVRLSTVSPRVDLSVPASVGLTLTSHLVWTYDKGNNAF